jgi:hypothetical protein
MSGDEDETKALEVVRAGGTRETGVERIVRVLPRG